MKDNVTGAVLSLAGWKLTTSCREKVVWGWQIKPNGL